MDQCRLGTLEFLRGVVHADQADFWLYDPVTGLVDGLPTLVNIPLQAIQEYIAYFLLTDEIRVAYEQRGLVVARSTDLVNYGQWLQQSAYYNEFLKTVHMHYLLCFEFKDERTAYGAVLLSRERSSGDFKDEDLLFIRLLYPHLLNRLRWNHALVESQSALPASAGPAGEAEPRLRVINTQLTDRQLQIARLAMAGDSNEEIALRLGLSPNTVKMHLKHVFSKLGLKRRSQLSAMYLARRSW